MSFKSFNGNYTTIMFYSVYYKRSLDRENGELKKTKCIVFCDYYRNMQPP